MKPDTTDVVFDSKLPIIIACKDTIQPHHFLTFLLSLIFYYNGAPTSNYAINKNLHSITTMTLAHYLCYKN